ncbi:UDP-2,4-diacetamido-2,4,6-trideoxy-beta-L-altropyranose hydrolase [Sulfurimonas sp.]
MIQNILVRADSSSKIGLGHIMRDLVLCKQFPHAKITFATQNLKGNVNYKILEAGFSLKILNSNKTSELLKTIKELKIDLLIIDNYEIDADYEKYLKQNSKIKILSLDDTYEKHHCDVLLNHNLGADEKRYKNKVPKNCELRCGTKYTLLRDEFYKEKKRKKATNKKNVFIAMGGTDENNISKKIIKVLKDFKGVKVNLVTSSSNKNLPSLKRYIKNKEWVNLHVDSTNIAKLMAKSSFAIVSPSVILNEVYFMELPFIAIKTASNQDDIYKYLKREKYLTLKKFDAKRLKQKIKVIV